MQNKKGFTLMELIIVIAVIALLAAATFVAVDPAKRIGQARDAQRWQDVTAIADAIQLYMADNSGTFPTSTDNVLVMFGLNAYYYLLGIGTGGDNFDSDLCVNHQDVEPGGGVLLSNLVPNYLPTMPVDPSGLKNGNKTIGYYIKFNGSLNKVIIGACEESPYATASIYVQR